MEIYHVSFILRLLIASFSRIDSNTKKKTILFLSVLEFIVVTGFWLSAFLIYIHDQKEYEINTPNLITATISPPVTFIPTPILVSPSITNTSKISKKFTQKVTKKSSSVTKYLPTASLTPSIETIKNGYYVSTSGSDSNPGTWDLPWSTIQKALNSVENGETIIVLPGTYDEQINISSSGITLQAQGRVITKRILVSGNSNTVRGFTVTDPSSDPGIWTEGDHNLIEGNEIYHTKQDGIWFFGSYNTFRDNYIHDILDLNPSSTTHVDCFQTWGWNWDTTHVLFDKNICINNRVADSHNAIATMNKQTAAAVSDITFRNNVFVIYRPSWAAIDSVPNLTLENNTIVNTNRDGKAIVTYTVGFSNVSIVNNLLINWGSVNTYQPYIATGGEANINIHDNAIYNYNGISPYGTAFPDDLWMVDPEIVSFEDFNFHLKSTSPLINSGYNVGASVTYDKDGVERPKGDAYDIGAYEF